MANIEFNTRIQNKIDNYDNWYSANPVLLDGELAGVKIPAEKGAVVQEPAVLYKVGDGSTAFRDLPFISGLAADVHNWAKASVKPTYSANEITELSDFIAGEVETLDSDTLYKLEYVDGGASYTVKLMKKSHDEDDSSYALANSVDFPKFDDTELQSRITSLETLVGEEPVVDQIADAVDTALEDYMTAEETGVAIANAVASAGHLKRLIVDTIPVVEDADPDTIYMVKDSTVPFGDAYKEYMLINGVVAQIGDTTVDLSDYAKTVDVGNDITSAKTDVINDANAYTDSTVSDAIAALNVGQYAKQSDLTTLSGRVNEIENEIDVINTELNGLANITETGNVNDLLQTAGTYIVFNCGSATVNI